MAMEVLEWAALVFGAGLTYSGIRAIQLRETHVPEQIEGDGAVRVGAVWILLGVLFILSAAFDIPFLKTLFRLFLEAPN